MMRRVVALRALLAAGDAVVEVGMALLILSRTHNTLVFGLIMAVPWWAGLAAQVSSGIGIDQIHPRTLIALSLAARGVLVIALCVIPGVWWAAGIFFLIMFGAPPANTAVALWEAHLTQHRGDALQGLTSRVQQGEAVAQIVAYLSMGWLGRVIPGLALIIAIVPWGIGWGVSYAGSWETPAPSAIQRSGGTTPRLHLTRPAQYLIAVSGAAAFIVFGANALLAPAVVRLWQQSAAHYAWVVIALSAGHGLGGRLTQHRRFRTLGHQLTAGLGGMALGLAGLAAMGWPGILGVVAVTGLANALFAKALLQWFQQHVPSAQLGRTLAWRGVVMALAAGGGAVVAGGFGQSFGLRIAFALWSLSGALLTVAVGVGMRRIGSTINQSL